MTTKAQNGHAGTASNSKNEGAKILSESFQLPCGRIVPNRLVKAPMEEMMGSFGGGIPNERLLKIYQQWSKGQWGMIITGNIAIDKTHLGTPFDIIIPNSSELQKEETLNAFKRYAKSIQGSSNQHSPLAVVQLVHAGRQSMRGSGRKVWEPTLAPSSVPMNTSPSFIGKMIDFALWNTPKEMTLKEIEWLKNRFIESAELCFKSGFDGVEIHGSHGYQIAAFLSPKTNTRKDKYGGSSENRARLLLEIIDGVRSKVPKDFIVGVKLNSSDYVQGGLTEDDALLNVQWLAEDGGVDFVEISGGNYENPSFLMDNFDSEKELAKVNGAGKNSSSKQPSARSKAREAFFQNFAQRARDHVKGVKGPGSKMALILTGGLRTRAGMADPISKGIVDGVGIGRMACVYPDLPKTVMNLQVEDDDPKSSPPKYVMRGSGSLALLPLRLINAGWNTLWHVGMLSYLSREEKPNANARPLEILLTVFFPSGLNTYATISPFIAIFVLAISTVIGWTLFRQS